jgi:hypothetical protein
MKKSRALFLFVALAGLVTTIVVSRLARAADHQDGTTALNDPSADITDIFAWMPDATHVALVMDIMPAASTSAQFSNTVKYAFHTTGQAAYGGAKDPEIDVICTFDNNTPQNVSCWIVPAGSTTSTEYVQGNASGASGISSADGALQVFAGVRNDPFFFNLDGFHHAVATVDAVAGTLSFDPAGCPTVPTADSQLLVSQLGTAYDGGMAQDHFAGLNVLALVLKINTSALLQSGHTVLSVWGSTNN